MKQVDSFYMKYIRRLFDILIGVTGIALFFIPSFLIICFFYQFGRNRGPIFFVQDRVGRNGKLFKIIKYRSMVVDAETILQENQELYKKYVENSYKLLPEEDPRLTDIGAFIRATSIDEIPQFVNVLLGDMTFIGPRPILENELLEYTEEERKELLSVKPGVTGWWQVSGRSEVAYPERCELELYYVRNASPWLDIKIVLLTVSKVILRRGAH